MRVVLSVDSGAPQVSSNINIWHNKYQGGWPHVPGLGSKSSQLSCELWFMISFSKRWNLIPAGFFPLVILWRCCLVTMYPTPFYYHWLRFSLSFYSNHFFYSFLFLNSPDFFLFFLIFFVNNRNLFLIVLKAGSFFLISLMLMRFSFCLNLTTSFFIGEGQEGEMRKVKVDVPPANCLI